jgi:NAD+ diphosphatase
LSENTMSEAAAAGWGFVFRGHDLLVRAEGEALRLPLATGPAELGAEPLRTLELEAVEGTPAWAAEVPAEWEPPAGMEFRGLRSTWGLLDEPLFRMAGRAVQLVDWDRTHRFCGSCATPTHVRAGERARECPACGLIVYPRLAPAVIMLVRDGDRLLLGRHAGLAPGMYSTLAGFVEPGESLEEAVAREVREETGVEVRNVRYFGSQPWPFPHSLMIGFTAEYAGGELVVDRAELEDAAWFEPDALPTVPPRLSIARHLVDAFLAELEARRGAG